MFTEASRKGTVDGVGGMESCISDNVYVKIPKGSGKKNTSETGKLAAVPHNINS